MDESIREMSRKKELWELYAVEYATYKDIADEKLTKAIDEIVKLEYETVSLELTPDHSVVFRISFNNNVKKFYIILHMDEEGREESFFTYFVGDDCINNGQGSFEEVIADVKTILSKKNKNFRKKIRDRN